MTKTSKEELAEIALELFSKNGFKETSVGDIEDAAGLKRRAGGFYRHFSSKEAVLFESLQNMGTEIVAEIQLEDVLVQESIRAELMFIAKRLISHARQYRTLRLLLQREAHKMPTLRDMMQKANMKLAKQDVVPWAEHALKRIGRDDDPTSFAFVIFGPVLLYLISQDRNQPAFGLSEKKALSDWADYWGDQLTPPTNST
ncbi:MAG: helix-turn-helix domain-containing protein [Pseudomonadota bacterium]